MGFRLSGEGGVFKEKTLDCVCRLSSMNLDYMAR